MKTKIFAVVVVFLMLGCGYYKNVDPKIYTYDSDKIAKVSAELEARDKNGWVSKNLCCGSMKPLIDVGNYLVIVPSSYGDNLKGKVVVYAPKWNNFQYTAHRLVAGNAEDGFIASGDNNAHSEASERVTQDNFVGEVISIYKVEVIK